MNEKYIVVITTCDSREIAEKISNFLVRNKLAACVQISNEINSVYIWKNNIENSTEYYCIIKTKENLFHKVAESIKKIHNYEVPEIIALPIIYLSNDYKKWIDENTL